MTALDTPGGVPAPPLTSGREFASRLQRARRETWVQTASAITGQLPFHAMLRITSQPPRWRQLATGLLRGVLLVGGVALVAEVAFVACQGEPDTIAGAHAATAALLRIHSAVPIPGKVSRWLVEYHGEGPGMEVAGVFMRWSIEHRVEAEHLGARLAPEEQRRLAARVAFAAYDRGSAEEFVQALRGTSSPLFAAAVEDVRRQQDMVQRAMAEQAAAAAESAPGAAATDATPHP